VRTVAFVVALCVVVFGAVGAVAPSTLVWIARHMTTPHGLGAVGVLRVVLGLILLAAGPSSRAPGAMRILGVLVLTAGLVTLVTSVVAIDRARALIQWWTERSGGITRLGGVSLAVLGGVVAYACDPRQRAA